MSDRDFSGRLPGPVTGRPRRPLSNRLSTASWSMRFSLFTMISGAPRSSSLFSRLFRLMTRRYRSLRSLVANRPPSSWTIGRRSGGMTGMQSRTMPPGELRVLRNALTTLSRLRALAFFCPLPDLDGLRPHAAAEVPAEPVPHLAVQQLVALEVLDLQVLEPAPDLLQAVDLLARAVPDLLALPVGGLAQLPLGVALSALRLELGQVGLQLGLPGLDVGVAALLELAALDADLRLHGRQVARPRVVVHVGDHVGGEVDDLLQVLRRQVEQVAEPAGHALEIPDVRDRRGQLDVAHPLAPHLGAGDFHAAALTDDALEPHPLVLAAVALPVPGRTEDLLAEEPVLFRLEGAVVDGLRLLHFAVGPLPDVLGGGQADAQVVEEVDVKHGMFPLLDQTSSTLLGSRRDRSMPSSSAARKTSSSVSRISIAAPSLDSTSTLRHSDCISLISTLNDSGIPGSGTFSPLTMAS